MVESPMVTMGKYHLKIARSINWMGRKLILDSLLVWDYLTGHDTIVFMFDFPMSFNQLKFMDRSNFKMNHTSIFFHG